MTRCTPEMVDGVLTCRACGVPFKISQGLLAQIGGEYSRLNRRCAAARPEAGGWRLEEESGGIQNPPASGLQPAPSLPRRAANFAKAAAGHVARGLPKCTQEQIDARLAVCQACELYQVDPQAAPEMPAGTCTHPSCGCPVARAGRFRNKLAWADQDCPLGKWGPVA